MSHARPAPAPDLLTSLGGPALAEAAQRLWDQSTAAWVPWLSWWQPAAAPTTPARHRGSTDCGCGCTGCGCTDCGCTDCGCTDCGSRDQHHTHHGHGDHDHHEHDHHEHDHHESCGCGDPCRCCIPEADVVVHARAGETRVVPFLLRNPGRREREVALAVGPWQVCDGAPLVIRALLEDEQLTLGPCEKRLVRLLVSVRGVPPEEIVLPGKGTLPASAGGTGKRPTRGAAAGAEGAEETDRLEGRRVADVPECASAYADVRFEGCARPQRVAVVVHPAGCDPVEAGCDCGCC